jgi:DNA-binding NtrC family response regulator
MGTVIKRRGKIVIIDDEELLAESFSQWLERDHDVSVFSDPYAGLEALRKMSQCDVIFCDLMMPGLTGMDLYERIQAEKGGWEKKIVFMSGGAFTPRAIEFLKKVPNFRIDKPFDMNLISEAIGFLMSQATAVL